MDYKSNEVMFSICIPVYNVEKYLKLCIDSVISQEFDDYEIILVNDGSTDKSGEICDKYASDFGNKIRVIHKQNEGLLIARYDAVSVAKGKYLLFLDSDDMFMPNILKTLHVAIESTHSDMIIFEYCRFFENNTHEYVARNFADKSTFEGEQKNVLYKELISTNNFNSIWSKCICRSILEIPSDYRKYKGLTMGEDRFLSLSCFDKANKIYYLKETLYKYRANNQSVVNNITLKHYKNMQIVEELVDEYALKWNMERDIIVKQKALWVYFGFLCISSLYNRMVSSTITKNDFFDAISYISNDIKLRNVYYTGKKGLSITQRITINLVLKGRIKTLILFLKLKSIVKTITKQL